MTHTAKHTYVSTWDGTCAYCGEHEFNCFADQEEQVMPSKNTAKHTPGPLKAVQIIIENSPCTWAVQRKNIREQWGKPSIATYIDNEADARLFAAAPAMYEALKDAIDTIAHMRHYYAGRKLSEEDIQKIVDTSRTALAQAEGSAK